MKYYIIAGEASGDLHASNLMAALKKHDPAAEFRAWGGDLMKEQGATLVRHISELAFMGFGEVLANLRTIFRNIALCKKDISDYNPDVVILVDYPGFNLRIAKFAHRQHFPVFYYISPQLWAWKKGRVKTIRRFVDRMFVILPFEKDFYQKYGVRVDFVGHPLLDALAGEREKLLSPETFRMQYHLDERPVIALLPGSRKQEVNKMLPVMIKLIPRYPQYQFLIVKAPSLPVELYRKITGDVGVKLVEGNTHDVLDKAFAALVTSGTATLETALMKVPEVVCYKGSNFSYQIAKRVVKVKFISLVNLIMGRKIVEELIQGEMNEKRLAEELEKILDEDVRSEMMANYRELAGKLGNSGASDRAARLMLTYLDNTRNTEQKI
jgi:lipid-A-disaccharide synthase